MLIQYTENFIKTYINIRSAFTNVFSTDITEEDQLNMYVLEVTLKEYYNIECCEEVNE